jgi:hypothetical protein
MQEFYINQNSTLPIIEVSLIQNGRDNFNNFFEFLQDSNITFSMINVDNGNVKVSNEPCYLKLKKSDSCTEQYNICYQWKKRDTKEKGTYLGIFEITFNGNITSPDFESPNGNLIVPIREKISISIQ